MSLTTEPPQFVFTNSAGLKTKQSHPHLAKNSPLHWALFCPNIAPQSKFLSHLLIPEY